MRLTQVILKNFGIFRTPRYIDLDDDLVVMYGQSIVIEVYDVGSREKALY